MLYGMALKAASSGLILYHHFVDGVPGIMIPFAFADMGFLVLFAVAYVATGHRTTDSHGAGAWG
jgi:hypothetical protein